ncbi:MAG: bifunctional DNA primase/polymerase [Myxococcota bacterium]
MAGSPVSVTQTRSPDNPDLLDFALRALRAGLRPVPVRERIKAPALPSWKRYQNHVPQEAEVRTWFGKPRAGVGLIMGNGVECLDFDTDEAWEAFQQVAEAAGHEELLDHVASGYLEKTPRGWHVLYRCPEVAGNQKLAVVDGKAVIETRGTGGFVITAPSGGAVHPTGLSYVLQRGGVEGLRGIHPEERAVLFDLARQLSSEAPRPAEPFRPPPARELAGEGYRPGDDYNARTSWREILEPHGWVCVKQRGPEEFWRRPGKNKGHGATVNFQGNDLLWVFTTSTPFQNERSYDKFGAYAVLNHGGDHSEAARELAKQGYGDERAARPRLQPVDISALVRSNEEEREEIAPLPRKARFPEHLLRTDGLVGDFASYISDAAYLPQPILALGSALTVLGAVMGRQVQTPGGLRTNVFALGLGESGCGKEATRSLPRRALGEAGLAKLATTDDVTGDAAIHRALEDCPSCVFMLDEVGELMKSLANPRSGDYKRSQ